MLITVLIVALVPGLPNAFPASLFINSRCAFVFERSTEEGWCNLSGTTASRGGLLDQVAWVLATQRLKKLSVNN